jgi:hypothetical protein
VRVERDVVDPHDLTLGGHSTMVVVANLRRIIRFPSNFVFGVDNHFSATRRRRR